MRRKCPPSSIPASTRRTSCGCRPRIWRRLVTGDPESRMRAIVMCVMLSVAALAAHGQELPIFDAHIHYSHDAWQSVPPQEAIAILRKAGVRRALVSSSGDDGQQKLYALAPELILPSLRPDRSRGDIATWVRDQSVI